MPLRLRFPWIHGQSLPDGVRAGRPQTQIAAGLAAVARAVCESLAIPLEDVWAHWEELPPGRVFAGGGLL